MGCFKKKSPHKEQAIRFLLEMNTQDFADQWIRNTKCPTGIKCDFESGSFGGDNNEIFANYIQDKYGDKQLGTMESAH